MPHSEVNKEKLLLSRPAGRNFTLVLNDAINDARLSWRAKGILVGCLSISDSKFSKQWIVDHGTEGRDAVIAALKELRNFGYLQNKVDRDVSTGRVLGEYYVVSDVSTGADQCNRRPENPDAGNPDAGKPDAGLHAQSIIGKKPVTDRGLEKGLTGGSNLPACCAGAGKAGSDERFNGAESHQGSLPSLSPKVDGGSVGKESEETPRGGKLFYTWPIPKSLEKHKEKIFTFWEGKQGAKTLRSWKMQMTELEKLQVKYGDESVDEQLTAAILAGNWHGIRVINYERYGIDAKKKKGVQVDMSIHPSYRPLSYD